MLGRFAYKFFFGAMGFREDNVVVIEIGSLTTRAVVGLAESMTPPQVRVATRIGIKRSQSSSMQDVEPKAQPEYLFGDELEEALQRKDQGVEVVWPIVKGTVQDWDAMETFLYSRL